MSDTLAEICDYKRQHVAELKQHRNEAQLQTLATEVAPVRGFINAIQQKISAKEDALIAEVKKASPSKGVIRMDFDPKEIARSYHEGGATCISVLTDEKYFQGHNRFLTQIHDAVELPILRKDFILDPYQVVESRAIGADCILLIMAAVSDDQASELESAALEFHMDVLVEVHNEAELERALKLDSPLLGINNRNLKNLHVDLATTERLVPLIPKGKIPVCESGIFTNANIKHMNNIGVNCFLVGESLMRENDIVAATKKLLNS